MPSKNRNTRKNGNSKGNANNSKKGKNTRANRGLIPLEDVVKRAKAVNAAANRGEQIFFIPSQAELKRIEVDGKSIPTIQKMDTDDFGAFLDGLSNAELKALSTVL